MLDDETAAVLPEALILARYLAEHGVRNTALQDFHEGKVVRSKTGDFSDVSVTTPYGAIPWRRVSRISDPEMHDLMVAIQTALTEVMVNVLKAAHSGRMDDLLAHITKNYYDGRGVSWDLPDEKLRSFPLLPGRENRTLAATSRRRDIDQRPLYDVASGKGERPSPMAEAGRD